MTTVFAVYSILKNENNLQRSCHLLDVFCTVGIEDVTDLKHFEGLLKIAAFKLD